MRLRVDVVGSEQRVEVAAIGGFKATSRPWTSILRRKRDRGLVGNRLKTCAPTLGNCVSNRS
jgi:hypothetical protein